MARRFGCTVAVAAAVAAFASCTSSEWQTEDIDSPTTEAERVYTRDADGLAESFADMLSEVPADLNQWAPNESEAKCAGDRIVEAIGVERLLTLGFEPQDPTLVLDYEPNEEVAVLEVLTGCIEFERAFLELFSAYGKLDLAPAACVSRNFAVKKVDDAFAAAMLDGRELDSFGNDAAIAATIGVVLAECFTDEDVPNLATTSTFPENREAG